MSGKTIPIDIHYLHPLSEFVSKRSESLVIQEGTTMASVVEEIFEVHRNELKKSRIERFHSHVLVSLNGKVLSEKDMGVQLNSHDVVTIAILVPGG